MRIAPIIAPAGAATSTPWTNPAATAALRSTVDMLTSIEAGIIRDYSDVSRIRAYAYDLRSTIDVFEAARVAITEDSSKENDSFLPLLGTAGSGVDHAETRLASKELKEIWAEEGADILAAIRRSKAISQHVADQLDPRFRPREDA